jgi:hypothetical protein
MTTKLGVKDNNRAGNAVVEASIIRIAGLPASPVAERQGDIAVLPEGSRGLFVAGGGSMRILRLTGVSRMIDMMLTGRTAIQGFLEKRAPKVTPG